MSKLNRILAPFERYNELKTFLLIFLLTILLLYLLGWPGCLVAAAIGGFFTKSFLRAGLVGFLSGLLAWSVLVGILVLQGAFVIIELFAAIAGLEGLGLVLLLVILLIGGVLGLVGSLLGNAIVTLFQPTE
jgi:hypothetical protein